MLLPYFDDYFDKVYLINLKERTDRLKRSVELFEKININNYKIIEAVSKKDIQEEDIGIIKWTLLSGKNNVKLSKSGFGCLSSHLKCYKDAIENNYKRIMIFEDDVCLNQSRERFDINLPLYLQECFLWLRGNNWDIFYFDNIKSARMRRGRLNKLIRFNSEDEHEHFKKINFHPNLKGRLDNGDEISLFNKTYKPCAHSYAINVDILADFLRFAKKYPLDIDECLASYYKTEKKYCYTLGIFDQLLNDTTNNNWCKTPAK